MLGTFFSLGAGLPGLHFGAEWLMRPVGVDPALLGFDFIALLVYSGATAWFLRGGHRATRGEGAARLAGYVAFVGLLLRQRITCAPATGRRRGRCEGSGGGWS